MRKMQTKVNKDAELGFIMFTIAKARFGDYRHYIEIQFSIYFGKLKFRLVI